MHENVREYIKQMNKEILSALKLNNDAVAFAFWMQLKAAYFVAGESQLNPSLHEFDEHSLNWIISTYGYGWLIGKVYGERIGKNSITDLLLEWENYKENLAQNP